MWLKFTATCVPRLRLFAALAQPLSTPSCPQTSIIVRGLLSQWHSLRPVTDYERHLLSLIKFHSLTKRWNGTMNLPHAMVRQIGVPSALVDRSTA